MAKSLVIVESPAKAKTINKYLGSNYVVEASLGHVMDLPKNEIGVELKHQTFEPTLIVSPGKEKIIDRLKKLASKSDAVYLAPDPDREGEAIAAHLAMQIKPALRNGATLQRVTFNEITQKAVRAAFEHPRQVNENLVDAQQTRRVLDRIVGYQISPLLWDKIRRGLSAGRVQTVALRLIVEREKEINAFKPVEYWTVDAILEKDHAAAPQPFTARLVGIDGARATVETVGTTALPGRVEAEKAEAELKLAKWSVASVDKRERKRNAAAPFTTSKLQQDASRKLGFNVKRTMGVAQRLYEGVEIGSEGTVGLITYMRTDSVRVSPDAIEQARAYISKRLGKNYLPEKANFFKGKKDAQDAHEAIRPTNVELHPDDMRKVLSDEQYRLYKLIWQRFVASQMMPAVFDQTTVEIAAKAAAHRYDFRVTGSVVKFDGYLKVYEESKEGKDEDDEALANKLPALEGGDSLKLNDLKPEEHWTEPPPRYNEASLVKELEERGIGRPSTYASIINTIQDREYVTKIGGRNGRFYPTEIGTVVTDVLIKSFPYIFDTKYTATLEEELDDIEDGKEKWTDLLKGFYGHFEKELKSAETTMENVKQWEKPTDETCDLCGSPLVLKWGKFGSFYACSAYDKRKPVSVAGASWKRDQEKAIARIEKALHYPILAKVVKPGEVEDDEDETVLGEVASRKELIAAFTKAASADVKLVAEQVSCGFTKENFATKPDLNTPEAQGAEQAEEYCENCGRVMVLRRGPFGMFMACPGFNEDPPCRTIRRLSQKQQQKPPQQLEEKCPLCGRHLLLRNGQYGEFVSCSGYPKCKYIKQNLIEGMKCPKCNEGDVAERKARTGNVFWGCTRYPKCDFTSNLKPVPQACPQCHSPYVVERVLAGEDVTPGLYLVCPNNKEDMPRRRPRKGKAETEEPKVVECHYKTRIGEVPVEEAAPAAGSQQEAPSVETHGPVLI